MIGEDRQEVWMTESPIQAVYTGGVFRPTEPVDLRDGAHVQLNVTPSTNAISPSIKDSQFELTLEQRSALRAIAEANSNDERRTAYDRAIGLFPDDPDDDYDLMAHLELNRANSGEQPLHPLSRDCDRP
jgi:predicted DNA-binding antitoxin AbrB/MazE fold protein